MKASPPTTKVLGGPVVAVLINNAAQFVNGSEQQPQFVIEMLKAMGIRHRVLSHRGRDGVCGLDRDTSFHGTELELLDTADLSEVTTFIMICHIVEDTSALSQSLRARLHGKKIVQFHCGNHCLFNAEDVIFNKHNVVRLLFNTWFTESWTFSMHQFARDYYELLTGKPCKLMPYAWSPSLLLKYMAEHDMQLNCDFQSYNGKLTLCCFEPNLNITKNCLAPLLMMNEFYKLHPDRVDKCMLFCTKHLVDHPPFIDYLSFLKISIDNKIEIYPRMAFPEVLNQMKSKDLRPVIIGHQLYNDQNYLNLEALYLGYPLVHNCPSIRNAGLYYDGWELRSGIDALCEVASDFHKPEFNRVYNDQSRAVIAAHSPADHRLMHELRCMLE